jgi:UDP-N-acetylmuramyl pentapeptide synthase
MKGIHKIAILGDMLELGEQSDIEHQLIVDFLVEKKIDCLLVGSCYNSTKSNFNKFMSWSNLNGNSGTSGNDFFFPSHTFYIGCGSSSTGY